MANEITFTNMLGLDFFPPKPAIKEVPDWYKNTPEYITEEGKKKDHKHGTPHTVKKCMPVFDSMTAGYILYTQVDVQVYAGYDKEEGGTFPSYHWPSQDALNFHSIILRHAKTLLQENIFLKIQILNKVTELFLKI
jgi:hypothetical protein